MLFIGIGAILTIIFGSTAYSLSNSYASQYVFDDSTTKALINTLISGSICAFIIMPISFLLAKFIHKNSKDNIISRIINTIKTLNNGVPSLTHGLVAYFVIVEIFKFRNSHANNLSMFAGIIAFIFLLTPFMINHWNKYFEGTNSERKVLKNEYIRKLLLNFASAYFLIMACFVAETSAFLLTVGNSFSGSFSLLEPQQTLTTRMMYLLEEGNSYAYIEIVKSGIAAILLSLLFNTSNYYLQYFIDKKYS
ncbi:hypothetical protein E1I18_01050 [Mycoplasmopsis mucosicanis]|uniref:Uncharacterized protein n=1 Tax=Mycoplasmopsis mucosicanis TaxID=458208 RepID=A0A507SQF3_9BACT|nr:hypothetical protein [Mycoplasmopsis mucosicanis]TQC54029.1 hypothetical protein E1I18_01050 [Mycoplasmopsis mucosicanis]